MSPLVSMNASMSKRQFEHKVFTKNNPEYEFDNNQLTARKYYYKELLRVTVAHEFYNGDDKQCPDFVFEPTPKTLQLMKNHGLLFKPNRTGFSVLYNENTQESLIRFIKSENGGLYENKGFWSRLSFLASLNNVFFINFTQLYFDTNPSVKNFYLSNVDAHNSAIQKKVILNVERYLTQPTQPYYELVPVQYGIKLGNADKIEVRDITDEIILCLPKSIPVAMTQLTRWSNLTCCQVIKFLEEYPGSECKDRQLVYIDFSCYPQGYYKIQWIRGEEVVFEQQVIYNSPVSNPLCFVDLFFTQPTDDFSDTGIYPVSLESNSISTVQYTIQFNQRSTYWVYWFVPSSGELKNLRIESEGEQVVDFNGPYEGVLTNGKKAQWFVSKEALILQQIPDFHFKLIGKYNAEFETVLANPLPLASIEQVVTKEFLRNCEPHLNSYPKSAKFSELYVYV
ncbi:hypothetical protein [Aliikangiella sp. IMCC44359]|uniref:hypothetical protein n=1 Tax=Aliikangiella sp. IMCC44359 TaxID=3459125 RepID=UPI00403ACAA0